MDAPWLMGTNKISRCGEILIKTSAGRVMAHVQSYLKCGVLPEWSISFEIVLYEGLSIGENQTRYFVI